MLSERTKALADALIAALTPHLKSIRARLDALEASQVRYVGTFESGRQYRRGEMVTDRGCVWHCNADTTLRPGDTDAWTLAVKCGRDGRDAR